MSKEKSFNVVELVNNSGCFDLQFRKDTRHERTGSPTYYRWKIQFIITLPKTEIKTLQKVANILDCGNVTATNGQARFSVQNIDDISGVIVPHFKKHVLAGQKKKDFDVWHKAVEIVWRNKGKKTAAWEKSDLSSLVELHKLSLKHKGSTRTGKWTEMAKTLTKKTAD